VDKHRELRDMLATQGAGVPLEWDSLLDCWRETEDGESVTDKSFCDRTEHAAILWLLGRGWKIDMGFSDGEHKWPRIQQGWNGYIVQENTLIDALLAAVTREVGGE